MKASGERSEALTERPKASGEYRAVRRSAPVSRGTPGRATYEARAASDLFRLCAAIGQEAYFDDYHDVERTLLTGWGDHTIPDEPPYLSEIGDDHSPFEFSLAFEPGAVELRLLVEAQAEEPNATATRSAALDLNKRLARRYHLDLERFSAIRDLFLDGEPGKPFSLWHAVCWNPGHEPAFKLYLNPRTRGAEHADAVVREALRRLGFGPETDAFLDRMIQRPGDELRYFSLDLWSGPEARVKVYAAHYGSSADELDRVVAMSPHHVEGDVPEFATAMVGHAGPFLKKPLTTCVAFVAGADTPHAVTVHLPIAQYVENDAVTVHRVARFLRGQGLDELAYRRAVHVFAPRALEEGVGVQSYASYRREADGLRFSAYLSPELFAE